MKSVSDELEGFNYKNNKLKYFRIGFPKLEKILRIQRKGGQLIVIASRPSMGKSSLALNIASSFAEKENLPVAFYSLEMLSKEITMRLLSQRGEIESKFIRDLNLSDDDLEKLGNCISELAKLPIFINDEADTTLEKLRVSAHELKEKYGLGMIIIDYLQLLNSIDRNVHREEQVSNIIKDLKAVVKELEVPVIILSQLDRVIEERKDKRPRLSDFQESNAIESEADIVMFLYRDGYYNSDCPSSREAEVIVAKNRSGNTGNLLLSWDARYTNFSSFN